MKTKIFTILLCCIALGSYAQRSGFLGPNRLGISYQRGVGIDLGIIAFNAYDDRPTFKYVDVSLGAEAYISDPFILAPKLNFDFGFGLLGGGVDVSIPTDFSRSTLMVTPKVGITLGSFVRVYYGRHLFQVKNGFPDIGKHRVSLEINIAALHDAKFGGW